MTDAQETSPSSSRSRRILWMAGALIILGELTVATILDFAPFAVRFPELAAIIEKSPGPVPSILLLGSSRLAAAVDRDTAQRLLGDRGRVDGHVVDGSVLAGEAHANEFVERILRSEELRPSLVVIEVIPETVSDRVYYLDGAISRHFTWWDCVACGDDILRRHRIDAVLRARLSAVHFYRNALLTWMVGRPPPYVGAAPLVAPEAESSPYEFVSVGEAQRIQKRTRRQLRGYTIGGGSVRALDRLLARLRQDGTRVVLLGLPLSSAHRALYTADIERTFQSYLATIENAYGARFIDWRDKLPDEYMSDHHHVAKGKGQQVLTAALVEEILEVEWLRK